MMSIFCLRFKNLTKLFLIVLTLIVLISSINFASDLSEQISEAQCITEYSDDTEFDDFDTVTFGEYPQSEDGDLEPIEWFVLEKKGDKALLLSKYILDQFDMSDFGAMSWKSSMRYAYLNHDFKSKAFNSNDFKHIIDYSNNGSVFVLSIAELVNYFKSYKKDGLTYFSSNAAKGEETSLWREKDNVEMTWYCIRDIDNKMRSFYYTIYDGGSPGNVPEYKQCLSNKGIDSFSTFGMPYGIRPAIWVSLSNSNSNSNSNSAGYITEEGWIMADPNMPIVEIKEFDKDKANKATVTRSAWEKLPAELKSQFREDQIIDDVSNNVQETTKSASKNGWDGDYYYQNDVPVKNTWVDYGSDKYYCGSTGAIVKNQWIDNTYYVDTTGKMLRNTTTPDGYKVGIDGKYIAETKSVLNQNVAYNNNSNLASQIAGSKCVTEYSKDTTVEQMDTVTFGSYPQSDANDNSKKPIEWIVLEKQGDKALLLSKYILDYKSYNDKQEDITWEKSILRKQLNSTFYNTSFSINEKKCIIKSNILNNNNNLYETVGGNNTSDYIFLLSIDECEKYFGNEDGDGYNKRLATKGTNYAITVHNDGNDFELHVADVYEWFDGNSGFWLRSSGNAQDTAAYACDNGYVELYGGSIDGYDGVRPAIWVNTSNTQIDNISEIIVTETTVAETKPQETKVQETKPQETKIANTTTNSSNKLTPLSEEELNDLDDTALFHLTVNNQYMDFIKIGTEKDGFLGLFGNTKYYVKFGYKLKLPEEELVTDYGNKYNNIDGNVIDCLGNKIKKYSYWIPSYTIYTNTKKEADNIKEYIESGNDYTAYFFDAMIGSTGKYKADSKSAIFKVPFTSDMVKYARPSKTPNIKLEQDDDGVELIDGYGMSVKIGKDISEVRIEFNKNISEDLKEKIMNYDLGHQTVGTNIIDNYGHKIVKFYYSSFGTYAIYAENYQEAEEIASELNNKDCNYTLYFYDNVKESTGKYKADKSKALFNAALTADMIKNAVYTKTKDMKAVIDENGLQIMEGLNVSLDVGEDIYEIRIELAKSYKGDLKEKIANYYFGHQDIGANIIDNYGHKILRFYDSSFGTYAIHAETEQEAEEITSVLNSSNCNYILYFFDNVIESTGKNTIDKWSAKFNVKFTKDMVKYATAKQNVERMASLDSEGFELMDGLGVSIEEGNDLFEVRIEMNQKMSEYNKNKITTYDVAHFEGYGKEKIKTKIYDNYGHRINRFYDSSFGTFMINAEDLDQAKEIASELNSSTCDYTLYFFD